MTSPLSALGTRIANFEKRRPILVVAALLAVIAVAVFSGAYRKPMTTPRGCPPELMTAKNLLDHGVFSSAPATDDNSPTADRSVPPAYPFVISLLAHADPSLAAGVDCRGLAPAERPSPEYFASLRMLQAVAGVAILIVIYHLALELVGSRAIACSAVVLYVIGGKLGEFARHVHPDDFRNLAQFGSLYLLAVAARKRDARFYGLAGACLGLATLFYPLLGGVLVLAPLALAAHSLFGARPDREKLLFPLAFLAGGLVVVAPWAARSLILFGDPMLADQSEARRLAHRVAFNAMPLSDWPLAALSWVPSYGNVFVKFSFGEAVANKFGYYEPGAYFANGEKIYDASVANTAPGGGPFWTVFKNHVLAAPVSHFLTSIPIVTRGMWGTHGFMGIVGLCLLPGLFQRLSGPTARARTWIFTFALLLVAVQALFAPNFYWMNTPMLFLAALAIACVLPLVAQWFDRRFNRLTLKVSG